MPRRRRELKARAGRTLARQRSATGPSVGQRQVVLERAQGRCEVCGLHLHADGEGWARDHSFHHRQARGAGGTSREGVNDATNLLLVCGTGISMCHGWIESQRAQAYAFGLLVKHPTDPVTVPLIVFPGRRVLLTLDGHYVDFPAVRYSAFDAGSR